MRRNKPKKRGFLGGFLSVFGTTLLLMLVALAVAVAGVPAIKNGVALTVLSGSMEPTIHPGDIIVVERVNNPEHDIQYGDVITFMPDPNDPTLVTHRVIGLTNNPKDGPGFMTQGDANSAPDEPILAKQVRGKLLYRVPYVGWATTWVKQHAPWLITGVAIGLISYGLWGVLVPQRRRSSEPPSNPPSVFEVSPGPVAPTSGKSGQVTIALAGSEPSQVTAPAAVVSHSQVTASATTYSLGQVTAAPKEASLSPVTAAPQAGSSNQPKAAVFPSWPSMAAPPSPPTTSQPPTGVPSRIDPAQVVDRSAEAQPKLWPQPAGSSNAVAGEPMGR